MYHISFAIRTRVLGLAIAGIVGSAVGIAGCDKPQDTPTAASTSISVAVIETTRPVEVRDLPATKPSVSSLATVAASVLATTSGTASAIAAGGPELVDKPFAMSIGGKNVTYPQGYLFHDSFGYISIKFGADIDCKKINGARKTAELELKLGKTKPTRWANSEFSAHFQIFDEIGQHNGIDPAYLHVKFPTFKMEDKDFAVILAADVSLPGKTPIIIKGGGSIKVEICQDHAWTALKELPATFDGALAGMLDGSPFAPKSVLATIATDPLSKADYVSGIWLFEKDALCEKVIANPQTELFGKRILLTAKGLQRGNKMIHAAAPADATFSKVPFLGGLMRIDKLSDFKEGETITGALAADNFATKPDDVSSIKGKFQAKVCRFDAKVDATPAGSASGASRKPKPSP